MPMEWHGTGEVHASKSISILHDTYVAIHFCYVLSVVAVGGGDWWEKFWMYWISSHMQLTSGGLLAWGLASRLKLHTITRSMFWHCSYFVNRGRLIIWILWEKQESGSVEHTANALRDRISPTYVGHSWMWSYNYFSGHRGPVFEWFAAHISV